MKREFRYKVGQDCWMVDGNYGYGLYRVFIHSRIIEETRLGTHISYRVKIEGSGNETTCLQKNLFDVATRCHDALCALSHVLEKKAKCDGDFEYAIYEDCSNCGYESKIYQKPKNGKKTCWRCENEIHIDHEKTKNELDKH